MVSTFDETLTAGLWITHYLPDGNATIFMKSTHRDINEFRSASSWGISDNCKPLALAWSGMESLTNALSQVLHTHSFSTLLMYLRWALITFWSTSGLAFVYLDFSVHWWMATCTHKIGPTFDLWLECILYWYLFRLLDIHPLLYFLLCEISSGISEALTVALHILIC